jgi:hypothetical protein
MIRSRIAHYRSTFQLASAGAGSGRRFVVVDTRNEMKHAGEVLSLDRLLSASPSRSDFVLLLDTLQQLDESELAAVLKELAAAGCKLVIVVPLVYSARLHEDGINENKLVQPWIWWQEQLKLYFPAVQRIATPTDSDAAFATWPLSAERKKAIVRLGKTGSLVKAAEWLRNRAKLAHLTLSRSVYSKVDILNALAGKSLSVVGNARSLAEKTFGEQIDANEIVVRFNQMPIISRRSHGSRTDWLATSVSVDKEFLERRGVSRVLWMSTRRRKISAEMLSLGDLYLHPKNDVVRLARRAGVERPSTGLMLIDLLAQSTCRSIELYGFDFFKSQSSSGHQTAETAPHDFEKEEAFVAGIVSKDARFRIWR